MPGCTINFTIRYANGQLAPFCSVDVFQVILRLWLVPPIDKWVMSKTANSSGQVSFDLDKGREYHFVFKVPGKVAHIFRTLDYCPIYMGAKFPS